MPRDLVNIVLAVTAVLLLAAGGGWLVDRARQPAAPPARSLASVPAGARRVTLQLSGMYCAKCASRIGTALRATPGVLACVVDAKHHRADVVCERGVADTSLVAAVPRAGRDYSATVVAR